MNVNGTQAMIATISVWLGNSAICGGPTRIPSDRDCSYSNSRQQCLECCTSNNTTNIRCAMLCILIWDTKEGYCDPNVNEADCGTELARIRPSDFSFRAQCETACTDAGSLGLSCCTAARGFADGPCRERINRSQLECRQRCVGLRSPLDEMETPIAIPPRVLPGPVPADPGMEQDPLSLIPVLLPPLRDWLFPPTPPNRGRGPGRPPSDIDMPGWFPEFSLPSIWPPRFEARCTRSF